MCGRKPKAPGPQPLPPPPPPPPEATPTAPVIDGSTKERLGVKAKRRGMKDLRIPLTSGASGLNVPQG